MMFFLSYHADHVRTPTACLAAKAYRFDSVERRDISHDLLKMNRATMNQPVRREQGLHKAEVFENLTDDEYEKIISIGLQKRLKHKKILFYQGDSAQRCYLVRRGRLKLTNLNEQGKEVIIRFIDEGELTAAVALLKDSIYPVTAQSVGDTEVVGWDKTTLVKLMRDYPDVAINLLSLILERIDDVQQRYIELCTQHVNQRIARSLLRLMRRAGSKVPGGIHIDMPLSRQSIADYSGTTLYTVSRALSAWEKNGWIISGREKIIITNAHALVAFAETG